MKNWVSYRNGNYNVHINLEDGTKVRENDLDFFEADTVESFDCKITARCSQNCHFCFEGSTPDGAHGDLTFEGTFLEKLHPYTEVAVGGGNPLEHPDLEKFLINCKEHKLIPSMTVNQVHFEKNKEFLKRLISEKLLYGLGVSLVNPSESFIASLKEFPTAVVHTIVGVTKMADYVALSHHDLKVLLLGYKYVRKGKDYFAENGTEIEEKTSTLKHKLPQILNEGWFKVLSFDNLALSQLDVKSVLTETQWNEFYMGDDGMDGEFDSATMFIDLVERKFAKNSCAPMDKRYDLLPTIEEMWKFLKDNLKMCEKAISFLEKYIDDLFEEKGKFQLSYDLWEEHEGTSFYSVATIFAAFSAMVKIYEEVKPTLEMNKNKSENIKKQVQNLEKTVQNPNRKQLKMH